MLYVFDVANGTMITFDAKFAFQRVFKLKEEIEKKCNIRVAYQVLLMSGGENLEPDVQVSSYSTGTDTNPVYLINKVLNETCPVSSSASILKYEDTNHDLQKKVSNSSKMQLNFQTLLERTQIAQEFYKLAGKLWKLCEDLVKIQHFQHQGWAAAVTHLDDLVQNCHANGQILQKTFDSHIADHQQYLNILKNLDEDIEILNKIPMLPELKKKNEDSSTTPAINSIQDERSNEEVTLLKWISPQRLKQLYEQCSRGFKRYNNRTMTSLKHDMHTLTETVTKINLKEIKHVRERLYVREQLMRQMTKLMQNQAKILQNFVNDYNRISEMNPKDEGSIADTCLLHHSWLLFMSRNHTQLRYIWKRCIKDKDKLSRSIQLRLRWMVKTENKIVDNNAKIITYNENLNRLYKDLEILRQVHSAPKMYANAVTEVVRRRNYSQQFFTWTNNLVSEMQSIYSQEIERRQEFQKKFEGHFLNELFPGLEDVPPSFATELPSRFDHRLPNLTISDLKYLKNQLSNLNMNLSLSLPNLNIRSEYFVSRGILEKCHKEDEYKNAKDLISEPKTTVSVLVHETKDGNSKNDQKNSVIIRSSDESFQIQTNNLSKEKQDFEIINEFQLLDYKTSLKNQDNKINNLKSLVMKEDASSTEDNMLQIIKHKLNFQEENTKKLWLIYKEMELKRTQVKLCQEKLMKEAQDIKLLESIFKRFLEEFENKSKELFY